MRTTTGLIIGATAALVVFVATAQRNGPYPSTGSSSISYQSTSMSLGGGLTVTNAGAATTTFVGDSTGDDIVDFMARNAAGTATSLRAWFDNGGNLNTKTNIILSASLGGLIINSNVWNGANIISGMPNFSTWIGSSNGVPVAVYNSNSVAFVYYLSTPVGLPIP